ncbi:hypothetical protein OIO90_001552 [Microbotryomycetes sp. JL221]|nr:hypothetical protein OIO90_001552 [Microbotryomycetes sp. JL221]
MALGAKGDLNSRSSTCSSGTSRRSQTDSLPAGVSRHASHDKLRLRLDLTRNKDDDVWLAGEVVTGTLELTVTSNELQLGEVGVEFAGFEELRLRDHTSTRRLLSARVDFQGGSLPPSNATIQGAPQKHAGFWPALRGRTRFPFSFRLPRDAPSSVSLGGNATTRYELRAFVSSILDDNVDVRSEKRSVRVVERWKDWDSGEWVEPIESKAAERLKVGADGYVNLAVAVGHDEWSQQPLRLFWCGNPDFGWQGKNQIELRARVQNLSKRHASGIKVTLCRSLRRIYPKDEEPTRRETRVVANIMTQHFHGVGFEFPPGEEREVLAQFLVPQEDCITKRRGTLFELDVFVRCELDSNIFADSLAVELPVFVAHPASLPPACHDLINQRMQQQFASRPTLPIQAPFSHQVETYQAYRDPYAQSVVGGAASDVATNGHWSSASSSIGTTAHQPAIGLHRTTSSASLACMTPSPALTMLQTTGWSPTLSRHDSTYYPTSPYMQVVQQPYSQQMVEQGFVPAHVQAMSTPVSIQMMTHPQLHPVFAPPPAPPAVTQQHGQQPTRSETSSPTRRSPLPARPLSSTSARSNGASQIPPTSPSPVPMHRSSSTSSLKSKKTPTPPPASPSARFSPTPVIASTSVVNELGIGTSSGVSEIGLLETIGEDGESQAGNTARSNIVPREVKQALAVEVDEQDYQPFPSPKGSRIESRNSAQDLEQLVAAEDMATEKEKKKKEHKQQSALDGRHVSSSSVDMSSRVTRAQDIFMPTKSTEHAPLQSSSTNQGLFVRAQGGLAALEARLSRPTTPVRSSPTLSNASTSAPPLSPQSKSSNTSSQARQQVYETSDRNDNIATSALTSKLSSLKMAPSSTLQKEIQRITAEKQDVDDILDCYENAEADGDGDEEVGIENVKPMVETKQEAQVELRGPTKARPVFTSPRKSATGNILPKSENEQTLASLSSPATASLVVKEGRKVVDNMEVKDLSRAALNRVNDWLKQGETTSFPASSTSQEAADNIGDMRRRTVDFTFERNTPIPQSPSGVESGRAEGIVSSPSKTGKSPWTSSAPSSRRTFKLDGDSSASRPAAANRHKSTKSEPFLPSVQSLRKLPTSTSKEDPTWDKAGKSLLRSSSSSLKDGDVAALKYDIRSARGGKGGVVTAVANKWTTLIDEELREATKPPPPRVEPPKALKIASTLFEPPVTNVSKPLSPVHNLRSASTRTMPATSHSRSNSSTATTFLHSSPTKDRTLTPNKTQNSLLSGPMLQASPSSMMRTSGSSSSITSDKGAGNKDGGVKVGGGGDVSEAKRMSASAIVGGSQGSKVKELMARYNSQVEASH